MEIEMDEDLKDLIETGDSKRYKDVARNSVLYAGLMRAYQGTVCFMPALCVHIRLWKLFLR